MRLKLLGLYGNNKMAKYGYRVEEILYNEGEYSETLGRKRQHYKTTREIEDYLDKLGNDGWELCGIMQGYVYIFKKELK